MIPILKRKGYYKYTKAEILSMIASDSYVPVASGAELNALRTATTQKMGAGTIFEGSYATGLDKKYIQVRNISLSDYQAGTGWIPFGDGTANFTGNYDGNDMFVTDLKQDDITINFGGLFGYIEGGEVVNMRFDNADIRAALVGVIGRLQELSSTDNILVYNSKISGLRHVGGLFSNMVNGSTSTNSAIFNSTIHSEDVSTAIVYIGAFAGVLANPPSFATTGMVENCFAFNCKISNASSTQASKRVGGFVGSLIRNVQVKNCFTYACDVFGSGVATFSGVGGFCGYPQLNVGTDPSIINCFSNSKVTRQNTIPIGGLVGTLSGGGFIINSYYDSETSGQSDTGKGNPRTTLQLVNGTANSFINPDGTIDAGEDPANAMFTDWDVSIWAFIHGKYPKLLKNY